MPVREFLDARGCSFVDYRFDVILHLSCLGFCTISDIPSFEEFRAFEVGLLQVLVDAANEEQKQSTLILRSSGLESLGMLSPWSLTESGGGLRRT